MKIICDNRDKWDYITIDEEYEILEETKEEYKIINNCGNEESFNKSKFKEVK